ncbi:hypothetical protein [Mesorhizobium sp. M1406]|uniref:hypothetical protein n=1 Tax=Mesorhizobium sp. M1406 TaxID=2957099 RepID=UPI0033368AD3
MNEHSSEAIQQPVCNTLWDKIVDTFRVTRAVRPGGPLRKCLAVRQGDRICH